MSLTNLIPALKGTGSRRAVDKVEELRAENGRLLASLHLAGEEIALLRWDLTITSTRQGEAGELVVQLKADVDDVTDERDVWKAEALALRARFGPQIAAEANTGSPSRRWSATPTTRQTRRPRRSTSAPCGWRSASDRPPPSPTPATSRRRPSSPSRPPELPAARPDRFGRQVKAETPPR
ncbi:hypothetical protein ACFXAW_07220 [Streptomyces sp. NPDC059445]|uniref:hypothetical protein n=1 Tax=Streptomyces sp. NPDC059445 TaxID=3346832 RepID=UPI0036CFD0C9